MKKYSFKCTCGDDMSVEAESMEEAKTKFKEMMTEEAAKAHFAEKHEGEDMPPYDALIENALANLSEEMEKESEMVN